MKFIFQSFLIFILASCGSNESRRASGICISFDDRTVREWYGIRDLLKEYDAKVTFFITQFDSLDSSEVTMLRELAMDGHEIGSHGALHVMSEKYIKENSYKRYLRDEIRSSISSMKEAGFEPLSFAYPYGSKYWFTDFLLLKDFRILRGVTGLNRQKDLTLLDDIYFDFDDDRTVSAIGIDRGSGLTEIMIRQAMQRAADRNEVLLLYGHCPANATEGASYNFDVTLLEFILIEANENKLKFYKISELKQ